MNTVLAISLSRVNKLIPFHVFQFSGWNVMIKESVLLLAIAYLAFAVVGVV